MASSTVKKQVTLGFGGTVVVKCTVKLAQLAKKAVQLLKTVPLRLEIIVV